LYGPNLNIPEKVSQYVQDPVTGQITTTAGPVMTAVSPIGAINLPARPVELDIFDYLGDPTYGSLLDKQVEGMRDGGAVPRQTMIGDQPHMLAYINPQEADLLKDLGGSGEPGPGGIPAYRNLDADLGVGATNTGKTYSGSSKAVSGGITGGRSGHSTDDDDSPSNVTSAPVGEVDFTTIDPTTGNQTTVATIDYGSDDDDGPVIKDVTYYDDTGTTEIAAPVVTTNTAVVDPNTGGVTIYDTPYTPAPPPPPVYTDRLGREYSSQALADAANRMLDYTALQNRVVDDARDKVATEFADRGLSQTQEDIDYYAMERLRNLEGDAPFTYAGIGGIGAGPESGSLITPQPVIDPDTGTSQASNIFDITPETVPSLENAINLNAPVSPPPDDDEDYTPTAAEMAAQLAAQGQTNVTQGPMSVAEQTGQYRPETDMMDIFDEETQQDANISAEQALNRIERGDSGAQTPSAATADDEPVSTPAASTQTASSTTSQDLNKGLGTGTGTGTGTDTGDSEAARMAKLYDRGLGPDDDPRRANLAVNAAEAKYLQNLLKEFEFDKNDKMVLKDPNVAEKVLGQVIKNLSLGIVDINDLNQQRVQAVLDAYRDTGSFVYDTEGNAIDLKTVEDLERLEKLSAGRGQEPAVVGVRDKDGKVVSFGPDIKNTMEGPVAVDVFSEMSTTTGDDDDTTTTTTDDTGHKDGVCNNPDYVYNPETDKCEPKAEETDNGDLGSPITTAITPRSFDEVLRSVVVPAPDIAPISANIRPMQAGGMVGLNRAADNFIKALAG
jgi:cell pole-organizing protein PopZ